MAHSGLTLRQLHALRRLDGLPMEEVMDGAGRDVQRLPSGFQAHGAAVPMMCEVACATDMDETAELEALRIELEDLKKQQPTAKVFAEKGVPCSDDESEPVLLEPGVPPDMPPLSLLDKDMGTNISKPNFHVFLRGLINV